MEAHQLSHHDDVFAFTATLIELFAGSSRWRGGGPAHGGGASRTKLLQLLHGRLELGEVT